MSAIIQKKYWSIAYRLLVSALLISSLVTSIAVGLLLWRDYNANIHDIKTQLSMVIKSASPSIALSIWDLDVENAQVQLEGILHYTNIVAVELNLEGDSLQMKLGDIPDKEMIFIKEKPLYFVDAQDEEHLVGQLKITGSFEFARAQLEENVLFTLGAVLLMILLLSLLTVWLVNALLTRHILNIAYFAENLTVDGLKEPLNLSRAPGQHDELTLLVDAVNNMRKKLLGDIHKREDMEKIVANDKVREASILARERAKTDFLTTMSHEIRTPMNAVIGLSELLSETTLNEQQRHYNNVVLLSSKNLLNIINDVLDYSKIESGKLELDIIDLSLKELLTDMRDIFIPKVEETGVEMLCTFESDIPTLVRGDPQRLRQVVLNLVSNAFKFTDSGEIILGIKRDPSRDQHLYIYVKDSGIGIKGDRQEHIFKAFEQEKSSTSRVFGGTGLGLAICSKLVELMSGTIGVDSEEGQGACFWFSIPLQPSALEVNPWVNLQALEGKHLLVLDEQATYCRMVKEQAKRWAMHVTATQSADKAMKILEVEDNHFDVILLDVNISSEADITLIKNIKQKQTQTGCRIIVLTAMRYLPNTELITHIGIDKALIKPALVSDLAMVLLEVLEPNHPSLENKPSRSDSVKKVTPLFILVAEDNSVNAMVIQATLDSLGHKCLVVTDGQEALTEVKKQHQLIDIVLMDYEMPNMNGLEATKEIRLYEKINGKTTLPIFALTAHALEEYRHICMNGGMNGVLTKPLIRKDLTAVLNSIDKFNSKG